jgi:hypothetical protein
MTQFMKEAKRWPGSEWLKDHPRTLEVSYYYFERALRAAYPALKRIGPKATERLLLWAETAPKKYAFNCQMCGQCILHSTGMTCPMTCPKNLRNGPCGGVRANGHCEVIPERMCVWVQAYERDRQMSLYSGEIRQIQPPVNRQLQNSSSWYNMLEGTDVITPAGWAPAAHPRPSGGDSGV